MYIYVIVKKKKKKNILKIFICTVTLFQLFSIIIRNIGQYKSQ